MRELFARYALPTVLLFHVVLRNQRMNQNEAPCILHFGCSDKLLSGLDVTSVGVLVLRYLLSEEGLVEPVTVCPGFLDQRSKKNAPGILERN